MKYLPPVSMGVNQYIKSVNDIEYSGIILRHRFCQIFTREEIFHIFEKFYENKISQ